MACGLQSIANRTALDLQAGTARQRYDGSRLNIDNSRSLSSFNGLQLAFGASLSRSYKLGEKSVLIPSLALQYNQVALEACTRCQPLQPGRAGCPGCPAVFTSGP